MKLAHTMIRVRDLQPSIDFYCGFLGMREMSRKDLGDAMLVFLGDGHGAVLVELNFQQGRPRVRAGNSVWSSGVLL